ncbi:MAG TPA: cbb3-type cytochrome oxidase assembly protein CcoS [Bdellovibrionales bacterium]|nr:cbb3-type cytochrome oxidase assembly protein CcoS [Pseudobdellovibrionaceae bacterium]HAG90998.1 cbb3-type cytochrome oxidase assembly protein CcoS [Bdellovibrionales bacterium]|tara:strand:+ start:4639 stop:4797 length:159 start_codon:yes stop_codon:yes gene_type:complete
MNILVLMLPIAITLGAGFLMAFLAAMNSGQFDDLETPAQRMLDDERKGEKQS